MNKTIQTLVGHRSIRRFKKKPIQRDVFDQLILSGQAASTSSYIQATSVIRVSDMSVREVLVDISGGQAYIREAAEFLVFCADFSRNQRRVSVVDESVDFSWTEQFLAASIDVALFAQNTVVAAESLGLGACFIGGLRNNPAKVCELLDIPTLVYPVFGLCLGYPDQDPEQKPRLPMQVVLHEGKYLASADIDTAIDEYDEYIREYYLARTKGKIEMTWSEQMRKQASSQSRPFMREFLAGKGFNIK